ncbi:hypothetical protein [Alloactinosynnema sp. L-07]|uniref:hypothetical protein n=1 Tax=Alloactinosynnema sp. L-07 TaxID=1653480 RepID=UPI00065EF17B|nr:hypothetical protein [Alloactinosynnema sp. L-07]CRK57711.1 hypothetical protein [Alloactinosynnema sp. L-07]
MDAVSARHETDDLWYFLRNLIEPAGVESAFAWDMIDRWQFWRQQKHFYRGGKSLTHLAIAPHHAVEEWLDEARTVPIEHLPHHASEPRCDRLCRHDVHPSPLSGHRCQGPHPCRTARHRSRGPRQTLFAHEKQLVAPGVRV